MKISKDPKETMLFTDVNVGSCFSYSGNPYIKIAPIVPSDSPHHVVNAVRLSDGYHGNFQAITRVFPHPDAEIVLN